MNKLSRLIKGLLFSFVSWFFLREVLISTDRELAIIAWCAFLALIYLMGGYNLLFGFVKFRRNKDTH